MFELIELRNENTKTYDLGGNKRGLLASIGAVHYKDDYASNEQWKDIDLTWEANKITKAPYELTLEGKKITIRDKKTGEISILELVSAFPTGLNYKIVAENSAVRFRHILPTDKIPFEAKFKVTGNFITRAFDDDGELELETSLVNGVLTEKLSQIKDRQAGLIRPAKGNIRIDPTWQVGAGSDDCWASYTVPAFSIEHGAIRAGYYSDGYKDFGSGMRFANVNIPSGATITLANLILTCQDSHAEVVVNTRLRCELNVIPATFSDATDFDARTWTSAATHVHWNAIPAWTADTEYTSPDFQIAVQEVANLGAITHLVVLWDDFEKLSDQVIAHFRNAHAWDFSTTKAPKLYVEYTAPPAAFRLKMTPKRPWNRMSRLYKSLSLKGG